MRHSRGRIIFFVLSVLILTTAFPIVAASATFSDVSQAGTEFKAYIEDLAAKHIVNGRNGKFYPNLNVSRGEFVKMLTVAAQVYTHESGSGSVAFSDVSSDSDFYTYIHAAAERKIVSGYSDHTFKPNNPVTRAEAAKMVVNAFGIPSASNGQVFDRSEQIETSSLGTFMYTARAAGLFSGYPGNLFKPQENLIRAHAAKIISRAMAGTNVGAIQSVGVGNLAPGNALYANNNYGFSFEYPSSSDVSAQVVNAVMNMQDSILTLTIMPKHDTKFLPSGCAMGGGMDIGVNKNPDSVSIVQFFDTTLNSRVYPPQHVNKGAQFHTFQAVTFEDDCGNASVVIAHEAEILVFHYDKTNEGNTTILGSLQFTQMPSAASNAPAPMSKWQTYTSTAHGFALRYPPSWIVQEVSVESEEHPYYDIVWCDPDTVPTAGPSLCQSGEGEAVFSARVSTVAANTSLNSAVNDGGIFNQTQGTATTVDGKSALRFDVPDRAPYLDVQLINGTTLYEFTQAGGTRAMFDQVLGTVKLSE